MPPSVPPPMLIDPNSGCPRGFVIIARATALLLDMIQTPLDGGLLAAVYLAHSARISSRMSSAVSPLDATVSPPLVIDAGEMPDTAVFAGLIKSVSSRA